MDNYQELIFKKHYARWLPEQGRRETWSEAVNRLIDFYKEVARNNPQIPWDTLRDYILNMKALPSMRALMTAGEAARRDNTCIYNCAYLPIEKPNAFAQILFILMNGTGEGFSVERQIINQLPTIGKLSNTTQVHVIEDSKEGWAFALNELIHHLYSGKILHFDYSLIRPAGSVLRTFGGRASGPEPLRRLFEFVIQTFSKAEGRQLTSLEVHDIVCHIAEIVVCGGVRRSSCISLSNLSDERMQNAKIGEWWKFHPQRNMSNNSTAYTEKPDAVRFMREWLRLIESQSGERGVFNRVAAQNKLTQLGRQICGKEGVNPCGEVILKPGEFCCISSAGIDADDTLLELADKVMIATILGTIQSTMTHFPTLNQYNPDWKRNCEEERLLGVSLSGIWAHELMCGRQGYERLESALKKMRSVAVETNRKYAKILGINPSLAITTIKPDGNTSQLTGRSSGIHPEWENEYFRTIRVDKRSPIYPFLVSQGVPMEDSVTDPFSTGIAYFYKKNNAVTRNDVPTQEMLNLVQTYNRYWVDHNVSCTISVKDNEWLDVGSWVYRNFDEIIGMTFLQYDDHIYQQAPYMPATTDKPKDEVQLNWDKLAEFEKEDYTTGSQELACTGGTCELS